MYLVIWVYDIDIVISFQAWQAVSDILRPLFDLLGGDPFQNKF